MRHPYEAPQNIGEQTQLLVKAGIAKKIMRDLPSVRANSVGVTLPQCQFWCRWTKDDGERRVRTPLLQVVVKYPSNRPNDVHPFYGCPFTVLDGSSRAEGFDSSQFALMERLAGPRPRDGY